MATIGELIQGFSALTRLPEPSVAQVARTLRDTDPPLIKSGGRGRSAAKMGPEDCAALLIGCLASPTANRAPQYVEAYKQIYDLQFEKPRRIFKSNPAFSEDSKNAFSFLSSLIQGGSDRSLVDIFEKIEEKNPAGLVPEMDIAFYKPIPEMRVIVRPWKNGNHVWAATFKEDHPFKKLNSSLVVERGGTFGARELCAHNDPVDLNGIILKGKYEAHDMDKYVGDGEVGGLSEVVTISHRTIFGLGLLIK